MPVGDDQWAREDAEDAAVLAPDPAMVLLGRAMMVVADVMRFGLPADGRMPTSVDVTVAALDEWVRALAQTAAFLAEAGGGDAAEMHISGERMIADWDGA